MHQRTATHLTPRRAAVLAVVVLTTGCDRVPTSGRRPLPVRNHGGDHRPSPFPTIAPRTSSRSGWRPSCRLTPPASPLSPSPTRGPPAPRSRARWCRAPRPGSTCRPAPPGAPEWLFIRNPVDHRRAAGYFIDHRERAVLVYDDTTLAREGIAAGWRDVLALGVSADLLDGLKPTGATAEIAGTTFAHHAAGDDDDGVADGGAEVWWSDELFVLGRMTSTAGGIVETLELTAMTTEVNPSLFADPGRPLPPLPGGGPGRLGARSTDDPAPGGRQLMTGR